VLGVPLFVIVTVRRVQLRGLIGKDRQHRLVVLDPLLVVDDRSVGDESVEEFLQDKPNQTLDDLILVLVVRDRDEAEQLIGEYACL